MPSWTSKRIGIKATSKTQEFFEQQLDLVCKGNKKESILYQAFDIMNFNDFVDEDIPWIDEDIDDGILDGFDPDDLFGFNVEDDNEYHRYFVYCFINKLFGDFIIYYMEGMNSTVSDGYFTTQEIYNPKTKKKLIGKIDYCYGDETVFGESVYNYCIKDIIKIAKEENDELKPCWYVRQDGSLAPGNALDDDDYDFLEFAQDIVDNGIEAYKKYGIKTESYDLVVADIQKSKAEELIEEAKKKGYKALVDLIKVKLLKEKINVINFETPSNDSSGNFIFDNVKKIEFKGKSFVTTGLGKKEEEDVKQLIESKGGTIKSGVSSKIDYLIVKEDFNHQTSKYLKACELKKEGANIKIIGLKKLKK